MTTTSPEALREAVERLTEDLAAREAYIRGADARGVRADQCVDVRLSDLRTLLSALQEAREALGPFSEAFLTLSSRWQDHEDDWQHALHRPLTVGQLRRAAEVYRALSPGGADE